jgi:hypothetical protein
MPWITLRVNFIVFFPAKAIKVIRFHRTPNGITLFILDLFPGTHSRAGHLPNVAYFLVAPCERLASTTSQIGIFWNLILFICVTSRLIRTLDYIFYQFVLERNLQLNEIS